MVAGEQSLVGPELVAAPSTDGVGQLPALHATGSSPVPAASTTPKVSTSEDYVPLLPTDPAVVRNMLDPILDDLGDGSSGPSTTGMPIVTSLSPHHPQKPHKRQPQPHLS